MVWVLLRTGGTLWCRSLHVQQLTRVNGTSSKKTKRMSRVTMYTSFFSFLRFLDYHTAVTSAVYDVLWTVRGWGQGGMGAGFIVLEMMIGTLYTVHLYIHTVSLLCRLTVSIMDAVYTSSFRTFFFFFSLAGLSRSLLTRCQTRRSYDLPCPPFSCTCLEKCVFDCVGSGSKKVL